MAEYIKHRGWDSTNPSIDDVDQEVTNGAAHVTGLVRAGSTVTSAGLDNTDAFGFYVETPGTGDWTITFIDGGTSVFAPVAGTFYPYYCTSINTTGVTGDLNYTIFTG